MLPQDFYKKTSDHKNNVVVIETMKGNRFGVYTEVEFNLEKEGFIYDDNAFLLNVDDMRKFKVNTPKKAVYISKGEFPSFGNDDICIHWQLLGNKHYSNFPSYYGSKEDDELKMLTGGERDFEIKDLEVYSVNYA